MKTSQLSLLLAETLLVGAAIAQPHRHHVHNEEKRNVIITATIWETAQAPDVLVYVDENGKPINAPAPTPAPAAVNVPAPAAPAPTRAAAPPAAAPPAPATPSKQAPAQPAVAQAPPAPPAPPAPAAAPSVNNFIADSSLGAEDGFIDNGPSPYGITWTGYKGDESNSACKTMEDADNEWSQMGPYSTIRVYGTDCDQPNIALTLGKKYNKRVFLGVYWLDDRLPDELNTIISAVQSSGSSWGSIDTISVGNEDVRRGEQTPGGIFRAVALARVKLRGAGYRGPIVHVDSQDAILANPSLCSHLAGDYIAANIHAFFNPNTPADQAGDFVADQVNALRACGAGRKRRNTRVRVTETGWPKAGEVNGAAVPSKANQEAAIASIRRKLGSDVFLFSAFNNYWMKNDASTFNAEHYWGVLDN